MTTIQATAYTTRTILNEINKNKTHKCNYPKCTKHIPYTQPYCKYHTRTLKWESQP